MYNYYFIIPVISFFFSDSFCEIRNADKNSLSQCYLPSHPSVIYHCLYSGQVEGSRPCLKYETNGTLVRPQCRTPLYYSTIVLTHMLCIDGNWNYTAKCSPECGKVSSIGTPFVIGGKLAKRAEVPWQAGIYTKTEDTEETYKQICGGSLISNHIVLSAAHCFWNLTEKKQPPAENYAVSVGNLFRSWNDPRDKDNAQRSKVTALHLPPHFQGSTANYQHDIAVVALSTPFTYNTFVQPVCVNFDHFFQNTQLKVGTKGKVAGWGLVDEYGLPSPALKVIEMPFVTSETCINNSPVEFRGYVTSDKMCAGSINEPQGVCKGDSGGGLTFPHWESDIPRYYLRGIVSTAPTSNQLCNVNFYMTFTLVLRHEDFIKQFWSNGEPCQLKPHPSVEYRCLYFGSLDSYRTCNEYEIAGTIVSPVCRSPGYYSENTPSLMNCVEGNWNYIAKCTPELACKEKTLKGLDDTNAYSMDNETLTHSTVKRDSAGLLTYFEMYVAIQAAENVQIVLTDDVDTWNVRFEIGVGTESNEYTTLEVKGSTLELVETPDILSSTQFRTFYIKIDDGKLEFGKDGGISPILTSNDTRFRSLKYFRFSNAEDKIAKIRYDCAPAPEAS